jgi:hypothetical protein
MKKLIVCAITAIALSSCGNKNETFEKDMVKVGEITCKFNSAMNKGLKLVNETKVKDSAYYKSYRALETEMASIKKEGEAMQAAIEKKYPNFKSNEEKKSLAEKIIKETVAKCK